MDTNKVTQWIEKDLSLDGEGVKLIPLSMDHEAALLKVAEDGELWTLWHTSVPSAESIKKYLSTALIQRDAGKERPFVVVNKRNNEIVGCTRYYNIQPEHRRLEIGYTWYGKSHQRTGVNTECKYLLLQYAFEQLNCIAVQFMTNWHNLPSRTAIARLGARQDGVLRNHRLHSDGSCRDSVVFSITDAEWLGVRKTLEFEMAKYKTRG